MTSESCPQCGAVRAGPSRFCQSCQFHFDADAAAPAAPASVAKKRPPARIWGWLFVIGAGLWAFGQLSSFGSRAPGTAAPPAVQAPVAPVVAGIGDGTFRVGTDISSGTYRAANPGGYCYWARLSGTGGTLSEIIANDVAAGPAVVTIAATDAAFQSTGCGGWTKP